MSLPLQTADTWTVDDLWALPPAETAHRIELQDGSLVVTPAPGPDHQYVLSKLVRQLQHQLGDDYLVMWNRDVVMSTTSLRIPDLLVIPHHAYTRSRHHVEPAEVTIAVEVVSPSTKAQDRLVKPAEYAAAGIGGYWRIELEPEVSLSAFALDGGAYAEAGSWHGAETAQVEAPLAVVLELSTLCWPGRG